MNNNTHHLRLYNNSVYSHLPLDLSHRLNYHLICHSARERNRTDIIIPCVRRGERKIGYSEMSSVIKCREEVKCTHTRNKKPKKKDTEPQQLTSRN